MNNDYDSNSLLLLMLLAFQKSDLDSYFKKTQSELEYQRNCQSVEWEQDMGAHIPFCKLTNDICDMHCLRV